jgi:F-type H+-transporting ATPase subunit c
MDAQSAKLLGAGLAAIGAGLASLGVGNVFAKFLEGALRNPGAADGQQGRLFIGFAAANFWACFVRRCHDPDLRRLIATTSVHYERMLMERPGFAPVV